MGFVPLFLVIGWILYNITYPSKSGPIYVPSKIEEEEYKPALKSKGNPIDTKDPTKPITLAESEIEPSEEFDDAKAVIGDAKDVIDDSKDAKAVIGPPEYDLLMDRLHIQWQPPIIHPPSVTEVNPRSHCNN